MTPDNALPNRTTPADPLAGLQALAPQQQMAEPDANQMAQGVLDTLRNVLATSAAVARDVPPLADKMRSIRQAAMEAMLQMQTMTAQGSEPEGY